MKPLFIFFFFITNSFLLQAQQPHGGWNQNPEQRAAKNVEMISGKIDLTPLQKDSLQKIFLEFYEDIKTYNARQDEKAMLLLEQTRDNQVKLLLADEKKFKIYEDHMKEMKERRKQRPEGSGWQGGEGH
jgi:hypothetical protein